MIELRDRRIVIDGAPSHDHGRRGALLPGGPGRVGRPVGQAGWRSAARCVASYIPWLFHELPDGTIDLTGRTRPERDLGRVHRPLRRARAGLLRPARAVRDGRAEERGAAVPAVHRASGDRPGRLGLGTPAPTRDGRLPGRRPSWPRSEHWYAAVMPVLAARSAAAGGPVIGVQLDNEIGMLAWVSNSPDLTDGLVADFGRWCAERYGEGFADRYPIALDDRRLGRGRPVARRGAGRRRCGSTWAGSCASGSPATSRCWPTRPGGTG